MQEITTSKGEQLTPTQIAEMSEVVAKYMGKEITEYSDGSKTVFHLFDNKQMFPIPVYSLCINDWNRLHEVWEKVRDEELTPDRKLIHQDLIVHSVKIRNLFIKGTPEQCFIALFEAIKFIESLKS